MKKLAPLSFFLLATVLLRAQAAFNYTWPLGYGGTYDISPEYNGMLLGFGQNPPSLVEQTMLAKPIAFICDATRNLRLYFNGCMLANGQHEIIENSDSINLGIDFSNPPACEGGPVSGGYQNAILLQAPGSEDLYYLFYVHKEQVPGYRFKLLYSIIDMSQNSGAGKVILKNQPAQVSINPIHLNTHISAVRHGNGRDWWIVCPTQTSTPRRLVLLLSPAGITQPYLGLSPGIPLSSTQYAKPAQIGFSADGNKYFRTLPGYGLEILDFNRCTGQFSNIKVINSLHLTNGENGSPLEHLGVASSPSGQFLYVSTVRQVFQFDLWADSILATKQLVFTVDVSDPDPPTFYQGFCAPNGKVYFGSDTRAKHLHVIHQPDLFGLACEFEAFGLLLPAYQSSILPNFANYSLLDLPDSPCDTLGINEMVDVNSLTDEIPTFKVAPNPSTGLFQVYLPEGFSGGNLYVLNTSGQFLLSQAIEAGYLSNISLQTQPAGLYWIVLRDQQGQPVGYSKVVIDR